MRPRQREGKGRAWHAADPCCSSQKELPLNGQYLSLGGHVLANEDLEIGLRLGWGLNDESAAFFSNVGVGWRY